MAKLHDSSLPAQASGGGWLYALLLFLETLGAVLLYKEGLPIYRKTLANPASYDPETTAVALGGAVLIQIAYWTRYRIRVGPPRVANVVLSQIVLFVARLAFTFPTAIFSFLFIAKAVELRMPASKYAFILFALFSLFCYVRELENLGGALASGSPTGRSK
jgi:hypothetical protein